MLYSGFWCTTCTVGYTTKSPSVKLNKVKSHTSRRLLVHRTYVYSIISWCKWENSKSIQFRISYQAFLASLMLHGFHWGSTKINLFMVVIRCILNKELTASTKSIFAHLRDFLKADSTQWTSLGLESREPLCRFCLIAESLRSFDFYVHVCLICPFTCMFDLSLYMYVWSVCSVPPAVYFQQKFSAPYALLTSLPGCRRRRRMIRSFDYYSNSQTAVSLQV